MQRGNWTPMDKRLACALPTDRPYTELEAAFSASLDYDGGNTVTIEGYAEQWGWSRGKVKRWLQKVGAEIIYPDSNKTGRNQRGHILIHRPGMQRTNNEHINLIDSKWLSAQADIKKPYGEQTPNMRQGATKDPEPDNNQNTTPPRPDGSVSEQELLDHFDLLMERFPNKEDKEEALEHYLASVTTYEEMWDIEHALDNYLDQFSDKPQPPGWGGASSWWFAGWQSWHEDYG